MAVQNGWVRLQPSVGLNVSFAVQTPWSYTLIPIEPEEDGYIYEVWHIDDRVDTLFHVLNRNSEARRIEHKWTHSDGSPGQDTFSDVPPNGLLILPASAYI